MLYLMGFHGPVTDMTWCVASYIIFLKNSKLKRKREMGEVLSRKINPEYLGSIHATKEQTNVYKDTGKKEMLYILFKSLF